MKYIDLQNSINRPFFRNTDVDFRNLHIPYIQLSRWLKDGHIKRVKRGFYVFNNQENSLDLETVSFLLYEPSYISLDRALSYHGLIPEMVYGVTCITTRNTSSFRNLYGNFIYHHVKPDLFWGYTPITTNKGKFLMAEPEKAILDYIYLNSKKLKNDDDISEWRINPFEFRSVVSIKKLKEYLALYKSPAMERTVNLLIKHVNS